MKYFTAILIGIALFIGGMYLPSMANADEIKPPVTCAEGGHVSSLIEMMPDNIRLDKGMALSFIEAAKKTAGNPPAELLKRLDFAVFVWKGDNAGVFFFDITSCYITSVTGTKENIARLLMEAAGRPT